MSHKKLIEDLAEEYARLQEGVLALDEELKAKYAEEKAERKLDLERAFAVKFQVARAAGVKRYELEMPVLKTKNGDRYKHFVELGGGALNRLKNSHERAEDRLERDRNARAETLARCGVVREYATFYNDAERPAFEFADGVHVLYMNGELWPVGDKGGPNWHAHRKENAAQYREIKNLCKEETK